MDSFAYYYFDFNDSDKQDFRGLLSSLLIQLCTRSRPGYEILLNLYRENGNIFGGQPSEPDMIQCLKKVLELFFHDRVYIIVDAVDESLITGWPSPRENILKLIKDFTNLHPNMRLCVTSRPEVDIQTVLEPLAPHAFSLHDEEGQKDNIINYIKSVVGSDEKMQKWSQEVRELVIHSLSEKAMGM